MSKSGTATETIATMDESEQTTFEDGGKITSAVITSKLEGNLAGDASSIMLMLYNAEGNARYSGYQTVIGSLDGKKGTIVAWVEGGYDGTRIVTHFRFLPQFCSGELVGLKGSGTATAGHGNIADYTFEYSFLNEPSDDGSPEL